LCNASRFDESVLVLLSSFGGAEVEVADCNNLSRRVVTSTLSFAAELSPGEDTPNSFKSNSARRNSNCAIGILVEVIII